MKRTAIAIASVVVVITPISWILLHEPQSDQADASVPYATRTDDTYVTPTSKPVAVTPSVPRPSTPPVPTTTPSKTPTSTPSSSPTGTPTTTTGPTDHPTTVPTTGPTTASPTTPRPTSDRSTTTRTTPHPTSTPTPTETTPPPPADDGSMESIELQVFNRIDKVRTDNGCAPLERDSKLTRAARSDAAGRAESGKVIASGSSMSAAGGDNWTAQMAFDKMMSESRSTVLNCNLTTLGVGFGTEEHCTFRLVACLTWADRNVWVADFK